MTCNVRWPLWPASLSPRLALAFGENNVLHNLSLSSVDPGCRIIRTGLWIVEEQEFFVTSSEKKRIYSLNISDDRYISEFPPSRFLPPQKKGTDKNQKKYYSIQILGTKF